jgi:hypothetical protein
VAGSWGDPVDLDDGTQRVTCVALCMTCGRRIDRVEIRTAPATAEEWPIGEDLIAATSWRLVGDVLLPVLATPKTDAERQAEYVGYWHRHRARALSRGTERTAASDLAAVIMTSMFTGNAQGIDARRDLTAAERVAAQAAEVRGFAAAWDEVDAIRQAEYTRFLAEVDERSGRRQQTASDEGVDGL